MNCDNSRVPAAKTEIRIVQRIISSGSRLPQDVCGSPVMKEDHTASVGIN
jgi:hypothetical protein